MEYRHTSAVSDYASLAEVHHRASEAMQGCLEADLSLIETYIRLSCYWYQNGRQHDGDRTRDAANKGIEHIRHCISKTNLLNHNVKESLVRRCNELELHIIATKQEDN